MTEDLGIQVGDGVCRITLRRPDALNALTDGMARGLVQQLAACAGDDDVRAVLIAGEGSAFCAGVDLSGHDPVAGFGAATMNGANAIVRGIVGLGKPVVAAVNGVAAGVGASICFAADLAITAESASFLLAFTRIGLMPDGGSTLTVASAVGRARAMRLALLAEPLTAREAYDHGLVSHLAADDEFDEAVARVMGRLVAGPPIAFSATKKAVNAATLGALEEALDREKRGQLVLFGTRDAAEGTRAFVEKRRPKFSGS